MSYENRLSRSERDSISLVRIMILSALIILVASSTFAQYQLRKTTTPTQQKASITVTEPAGAVTWDKGQRYTVKWKSEGRVPSVKIVLIDQANKSHDVVRSTTNSGSHTFTVSTHLADGTYRVVVMTADGSVKGEVSGTVTIQKKTFGKTTPKAPKAPPAGGGAVEQPESPATGQRTLSGVTRPSGLAGQIGTQQGGVQPGELTATKDEDKESPGLADFQVGGATGGLSEAGVVVHREITAVPATAAHIEYIDAMSADELRGLSATLPSVLGGVLFVSAPVEGAVWVAGNHYPIEWTSDDLSGDVKIDLVWWATTPDREVYPIVASTENDGTFDCLVPPSLGCKPEGFRVRVTALDNQAEAYSPRMIVYTEPVDMTCKIMNMKRKTDKDYYYVYATEDEWLEFDICLRNNGTQASVTVPAVSVIIIKEPEEIVIHQEEWGFSGIHPRLWYMTPDPRKFNIRGFWADVIFRSGETVDMENGAYRVEVMVDPLNQLGEDPGLREDNSWVVHFEIK